MATKETLKKVGEGIEVKPLTKEFKLNSFDLVESLTGAEIEEALGENHLFFDRGEVYTLIGNLISKQANGEEGVLLNNGNANLFYTEKFVVYVYWSSFDGRWDVGTWGRDDDWDAEDRVFSPAI